MRSAWRDEPVDCARLHITGNKIVVASLAGPRSAGWLITRSHEPYWRKTRRNGCGLSRWHGSRECHCVIERSVPDRDGAYAMTILPHSILAVTRPARWWSALARYAVSVTAILADIVVIIGISLLMGFVYHEAAYGDIGPLQSFIGVGATAAGIFVLPGIFRGEYDLSHYLTFRPHIR